MNRRTFVRTGAAVGTLGSVALAGCTQLFTTGSQYAPPMVENRPNAVYIPSHKEGMEMAGMSGMDSTSGTNNSSSMDGMSGMNDSTSTSGMSGTNNSSMDSMSGMEGQPATLRCALTYSYPHRFWTVTGSDTEKVSIASDDTLHLMVSVWDAASGVYVMDTSPTITVSQDDEEVTTNTPWTMVSQNMGFHAGDNVTLPGEGTYTAKVEVPAVTTRRLRGFDGQFTTPRTFEFEFDYSQETLENLSFQRLDDRKGNRQAISPMEMDMMPLSTAPAAGSLPGRTLGRTKTADDIVFVATAIPDAADFDIDGSTYLAVSARTPYNRYVLPAMSLSGTLTRNGQQVFDGPLTPALDPELDYHYGTGIDTVQAGDVLELSVETPPQVARHEGYETAFLQTATTRITIE
ncbi:iron transporter [Halococcus hamelinensis]|uniref:DUF7350 domain-containing protein n=1 Tax=Halococcus hamelinensis 100A6 TaxID=1132509 RepID=M0LVH7_9EURY|nr:iron transporter [Halococcus hamelinensis]EMA37567.1 hypothetical protein C447_12637 [Halococcus hamelinensis 100A6]